MYHRSPIALAVLALLREAPMHPYRMQQLLTERGKYEVINIRQRASLYQTIDRLLRAGLIAVRETIREEKRPERTVYELTAEGHDTAEVWMREIVAAPKAEFPEFPAALSLLMLLTPDDARRQFEARAVALRGEVARLDSQLQLQNEGLPRLFLLDAEYLRAMAATELEWVRAVIDDLRAGRLTWSEAWLREIAVTFSSPSTDT